MAHPRYLADREAVRRLTKRLRGLLHYVNQKLCVDSIVIFPRRYKPMKPIRVGTGLSSLEACAYPPI